MDEKESGPQEEADIEVRMSIGKWMWRWGHEEVLTFLSLLLSSKGRADNHFGLSQDCPTKETLIIFTHITRK